MLFGVAYGDTSQIIFFEHHDDQYYREPQAW